MKVQWVGGRKAEAKAVRGWGDCCVARCPLGVGGLFPGCWESLCSSCSPKGPPTTTGLPLNTDWCSHQKGEATPTLLSLHWPQEALLYPSEVLGLLRTGSFLPPHWKPAACFKEVQAVLLETPRGSHTGKTDVQTSEWSSYGPFSPKKGAADYSRMRGHKQDHKDSQAGSSNWPNSWPTESEESTQCFFRSASFGVVP